MSNSSRGKDLGPTFRGEAFDYQIGRSEEGFRPERGRRKVNIETRFRTSEARARFGLTFL